MLPWATRHTKRLFGDSIRAPGGFRSMLRLDDENVLLPDLWATYARFQPDKPAVVCGDRRLSWREMDEGLNRVANALLAAGVGRGDKVAVLMTNSVEALLAMFGIVKAGACVVPISALLTSQQIASLLDDSDSIGVIASSTTRPLLEPVLAGRTGLRGDLRISVGFEAPGWREWDAWLANVPVTQPAVRYSLSDDFNIIYSSGTTGEPKGIVQSHRARLHWSFSNAIEMRFDDTSVALATTSLYSNGTWFMLLPPLFTGGTIVIMEAFTPAGFFDLVEREGVTHTFMVPTQYIGLLAHEALATADLTSLKVMISAGSPLRDDTKRRVLERLGRGLFELYGFSEGFATIIKPEAIMRSGSVGKPVIGFDLRILDPEGTELGPDEPGEIAGYGAGLMTEYYKKPDLTAAAIWQDERGRTFFRSGDIGRLDREGFLYILDRKKDMIISGGFNVFPKDIEEVVGAHPDVLDVTVIGVPDEKWGEVPLALVIPQPQRDVDLEGIRTWANERLAKPQRLKAVEVREEFPRNALGKVLKRFLREPYWQDPTG